MSGVVYNIDLSRPVGQRIRGLAYEGRIVQPNDSFTMAFINMGASTTSQGDPLSEAEYLGKK